MRILICGGGTGGHVYPALAVVAELQRQGFSREQLLWVGTRGQMEEELVPRAGLNLETIPGGPIVGVPVWTTLMNGMKLATGYLQAESILGRYRPDAILMTGGYVNVPVGLAARRRHIPMSIFLPDVEPGSAIRFISKLTDNVACTTDGSRQFLPESEVVVTGYPVRADVRAALELSKAEALAQFDLAEGRRTLFVFGGSRGARTINRALNAILPELLADYQVIHISGTLDWAEVEQQAAALPAGLQAYYRAYPYLHERMGAAFRAADLVLARAGASMLGEGPAFGLPAVLVPYPYAWRYQKVNADYLADRGAGIRLNDEDMGEQLGHLLLNLLGDEKQLATMSAAARALDIPDAPARIAQVLVDLAGGKQA
ncbi:MAG: undecaprenyldiphospho-muramoylpentapeptide beta-N-acetylglucosaminyltransferase [Anaerolineales bacterium]|nr:undecaprenyldiphospho-muramoylpentapeptide beta-N-acetylglucosaminyltransferase [Anaerolineales bacterium]